MVTPLFESTVRIPRVAALGLATTESYYEDPSCLVRSASLKGVWDPAPVGSDHLGFVPTPPNVSINTVTMSHFIKLISSSMLYWMKPSPRSEELFSKNINLKIFQV